MTSARLIEYRITRDLLEAATPQADSAVPERPVPRRIVERVISVAAGAAGLVVIGSIFPELVAAALAASLIVSLK